VFELEVQIELKKNESGRAEITKIATRGTPEGSEEAELQAKLVRIALHEVVLLEAKQRNTIRDWLRSVVGKRSNP
jgi:hypothetical protein